MRETESQEAWAAGDARDREEQCEDEGTDELGQDASDAKRNPAYYARLKARRGGGGDGPMRVSEFLETMASMSPQDKRDAAATVRRRR